MVETNASRQAGSDPRDSAAWGRAPGVAPGLRGWAPRSHERLQPISWSYRRGARLEPRMECRPNWEVDASRPLGRVASAAPTLALAVP